SKAHVQLTGAIDRPRLAAVFSHSDVFLLTSSYEGLPLALLEAMAAAVCPVVMRVDSGVDDVLVPDENALVIPQGDTSAMVEAVIALDRDRAALERLKIAARQTIAHDFSVAQHVKNLARIVDDCWRLRPPDPDSVPGDPTVEAVEGLVSRAATTAKPVVVFGAGMVGRKVIDACDARQIPVGAWFDSDPARTGMAYRGVVCQDPSAVIECSDAVFIAASLQFAPEMAARIAREFAGLGRSVPQVILP
ncbi:MAG: glycosyltransferase, partial [Acidobacteriota bacterium]